MLLAIPHVKDSRTELALSPDFILRHPFPLPPLPPTVLGFLNFWAQCSTTRKKADSVQGPDETSPWANHQRWQFMRHIWAALTRFHTQLSLTYLVRCPEIPTLRIVHLGDILSTKGHLLSEKGKLFASFGLLREYSRFTKLEASENNESTLLFLRQSSWSLILD